MCTLCSAQVLRAYGSWRALFGDARSSISFDAESNRRPEVANADTLGGVGGFAKRRPGAAGASPVHKRAVTALFDEESCSTCRKRACSFSCRSDLGLEALEETANVHPSFFSWSWNGPKTEASTPAAACQVCVGPCASPPKCNAMKAMTQERRRATPSS